MEKKKVAKPKTIRVSNKKVSLSRAKAIEDLKKKLAPRSSLSITQKFKKKLKEMLGVKS